MNKQVRPLTISASALVVALLSGFPIRTASAQEGAAALPPAKDELFQQDVAWSPDGRWIAFSELPGGSDFKPDRWAIYVMAADGSGRRRLVENAMWVSWSGDGKKLAFGSPRDGNPDIYAINADGSQITRLTNHADKDQHPAWSPKADRIAFSSDREGNADIYVMAADGSAVTRLTRDPAKDFNPIWSPDGNQLVFFREKGDHRDQIHVVTADGSKEWAVTADEANNVFPSFLSDGRFAFTAQKKDERSAIVCVTADGKGERQVLPVEAFFARWSPDGRQVAFVAGHWPKSAIYVMDAKGGDIKKIAN